MASLRERGKNWYFKFVAGDGRPVERKGCPDKRVTEEMARAAESEAGLVRAGLTDPKELAYRAHEARPLADHLGDWHAYLIGKESTREHANLSRNRVARLIGLAGARRISDLSTSGIQAALKAVRAEGARRKAGASLRSVHHYTRAVKGFSRWLWRDKRARENTLAHLTSPNPDQDRRHVRRALPAEELSRSAEVFSQARATEPRA